VDGTKLTGILVVLSWIALGLMLVKVLRRRDSMLRRNLPTVIMLSLILIVPLLILLVRYGQVSCAVLPPEQACTCYAQAGFRAENQKRARTYFARADDICPGNPTYQTLSGRSEPAK